MSKRKSGDSSGGDAAEAMEAAVGKALAALAEVSRRRHRPARVSHKRKSAPRRMR